MLFFELSQKEIKTDFKEKTETIEISSNTSWNIINIPDWVSFNTTQGSGNINLEVYFTKNPRSTNGVVDSRTAEVLFVTETKTTSLVLTQNPYYDDRYLTTTSPKEYTLDSEAQTITLEISSNATWTLSDYMPDWINVSPKTGSGDNVQVTLDILENKTNEYREWFVKFDIENPHVLGFSFHQNAPPVINSWELITQNTNFTTARNFDLSFDKNNIPFFGYSSSQIGSDAYFYKYEDNDWNSNGTFEGLSIKTVFTKNNIPYTFYVNSSPGSNQGFASLKKYVNNVWKIVANNISDNEINYLDIAVDSNDNIYMLYEQEKDGQTGSRNKIIVKKYDGTDFTIVGQEGFSNYDAKYCKIAIDSKNNIYVAYSDSGFGKKIIVRKFNGTSWDFIGNQEGFSEGEVLNIQLSFDMNDTPIVGYFDNRYNYDLKVQKLNNGNWETLGVLGSGNQNGYSMSMSVYENTPYIAVLKQNGKVVVKKLTNSNWEDIGEIHDDITEYYKEGVSKIILKNNPSNGKPYIAFKEKSGAYSINVIKYNK